MKTTKSAKKKVDLSTISSALQGAALKAKMPKGIKHKSTKDASKKATKKTKSAKSLDAHSAQVTKSDPTYSEGMTLESWKKNMERIIKGTDSAAEDIKSKVKKMKKRKFNGVKNGRK